MFIGSQVEKSSKITTHQVVLPFYGYAALSFLLASLLLFFSTEAFLQHYFQPKILAITHLMALGWGTMIILGASHQLVPVLIENPLFSNLLALITFLLAALGIPFLVYGFYCFDMGWPTQLGAIFVNAAVLCYLVNLIMSISKSKNESVHSIYIFTATIWLLFTTLIGLLLIYNFSGNFLSFDSLHFLPFHAHIGMVGWFLLLVIGVGSKLIPMFLISKYSNPRLLWIIYSLNNLGLVSFILFFFWLPQSNYYLISGGLILSSLILFVNYCYQCYKQRIRKQVDPQMKLTVLSVVMMILPVLILLLILAFFSEDTSNSTFFLLYGFLFFFGWLSAIIFGMTFKTLPFIVWNKVYHHQTIHGKSPNPKDLFSSSLFTWMSFAYLLGFILFIVGIFFKVEFLLKSAAGLLIFAAFMYNWNVGKTLFHQSTKT